MHTGTAFCGLYSLIPMLFPPHVCELLRVMTFEPTGVQMSSLAISTHTRMGEPGDGAMTEG